MNLIKALDWNHSTDNNVKVLSVGGLGSPNRWAANQNKFNI